jgi:hypothetical protein
VSLPRPEAGLVVRYSYLWHAERVGGREEGAKDRPCAIILAVADAPAGAARVWLLPVTHRMPSDREDAETVSALVLALAIGFSSRLTLTLMQVYAFAAASGWATAGHK